MDIMLGTTIINPSGLDASAVGNPSLVRGVSGRAVELDTPAQYVKVSGPGHRFECFGDLDLCNLGKSLIVVLGRYLGVAGGGGRYVSSDLGSFENYVLIIEIKKYYFWPINKKVKW